jgi:uncharacterized membrane protein YqaE (UPF0057 family)
MNPSPIVVVVDMLMLWLGWVMGIVDRIYVICGE